MKSARSCQVGAAAQGNRGGALRPLCAVSNWATLMICELNPHHGAADGTTLRRLVAMLAELVALS